MKIIKVFSFLIFVLLPFNLFALDLFSKDEPIRDGLNVFKLSDVFTEIYEKLDDVQWNGKSTEIALESLANIHPKAQIEVVSERIVLLWGDNLIANYPLPDKKDWNSYGQITTAFVLRMREKDARLHSMDETNIYNAVVKALLAGIDEKGGYIFAEDEKREDELKILTSLGFEGGRDERSNFRVTGVFKGSPADIAGINQGDIISEINGERVSVMSDSDLRSVLNGYNSGTVKVKLLTPTGNKNVSLRRASVMLADADVIHRVGNTSKILEIVIHNISENAVDIVNEALAKYQDVEGIVLDLRTSTGENEKSAAKLAGLFIGQRPVMVISEAPEDDLQVIPGGNAVTNLPVVVLISDSTRGMAEALASAFYENRRGLLVGTPTAGRARMPGRIHLTNGGILELLTKSIKTGNGNALDGRGVFPLICLSNIRGNSEKEAFFVNITNGTFNIHDYNQDDNPDVNALRRGCPNIVSGSDEDAMAIAVGVEILANKIIYSQLMGL